MKSLILNLDKESIITGNNGDLYTRRFETNFSRKVLNTPLIDQVDCDYIDVVDGCWRQCVLWRDDLWKIGQHHKRSPTSVNNISGVMEWFLWNENFSSVKPYSHNMQPTVIEDFPEPPQIPPSPPMVPTPPSKSPDLSISIVADSTGAPSSLPPAPPSPPPAPRLPQRSHSITRLDQINQDYKDFQEEMRDYRSPTPPPIPRTPSPLKAPFNILPWYHWYRFSHHPRVIPMRQFDWL